MTLRVLLVPDISNPGARDAAVQLIAWLTAQGVTAVAEAGDAAALGMPDVGVSAANLGELELVVALGGDGTILKAVHLLGESTVPVLGVKFGRLGFLSGARADTMREAVTAALAGEVSLEHRSTLRAEVHMDGRCVGSYLALNEVALARGSSGRVVSFALSVDGHHVMRTRADALIASTATGSTAYALSAGGPILHPSVRGIVVLPVAPHTLAARAMVTGPSSTIEIELPEAARSDACIVVDGDVKPCRQAIERVVITQGAHDVALVKLEGRDFYETVASEFFGG